MAFCTKCGALLEEGGEFCANCGEKAEQKAQGTRCAFCGNIVEEGLHYCSYCGADLSDAPDEAPAPEAQAAQPAAAHTRAPVVPAAQPAGPERELYRRGMVTWLSGLISVIGTLTVSTHKIVFTPMKLYLTAQTLELPVAQIKDANTAKMMAAVPGAIQVRTVDGKAYTFGFGAVYVSEAERAVQAVRQAIGGLR